MELVEDESGELVVVDEIPEELLPLGAIIGPGEDGRRNLRHLEDVPAESVWPEPRFCDSEARAVVVVQPFRCLRVECVDALGDVPDGELTAVVREREKLADAREVLSKARPVERLRANCADSPERA
jgi:hypothetical protein